MEIAWDYLTKEQIAQILHFRPDLKEKKDGNKQKM